jgi:hypothetical protein
VNESAAGNSAGPAAGAVAGGPVQGADADGGGRPSRRQRGLPGGRVVTVGTLVVVTAAGVEAIVRDRIGVWAGGTLIAASVVAALVTRAGDRSLPAMMPPLAFLAAALVAGQLLVTDGSEPWWARQGAMLVEVLGRNALFVVVATVLAVLIALVRHLADPPVRG